MPANLQPAQGYKGSGSTLDLNHVQSSQFSANREANIPFEAPDTCNGISISGKLKVILKNHSLWLQFSRQQTEMILNRSGRRLFPFPAYKIQGMNPVAHYQVFLEVVPVDQHRWRYQNGDWSQCEKTENNMLGNQLYIHPDSPNTGAHWMKKEIKFEKLKVTNNEEATNKGNKMILLQSFHKYQLRLGIEEVRNGERETPAPSSFIFPETEFIAVTAYQNAKLSRLKILYNPFAKGFREHYYPEEHVNKHLASVDSTAMVTAFPETDSCGSLLELGEGSCQAKERAPLSPGLLAQAAQPLQGYAYDCTPRSSNFLSLGMSGMECGFLPFTSPPTTHHNPRQDAVFPQGDWCPSSSSNCTKTEGGWLHSVPPVPMDTITRAEEEKQLEEELWIYAPTSDSNDFGLGEEVSKERALSPDDSGNEMCSG
ncbi:T-box transcription factor TBX21-like [Trichosurus vulpecula]|uniref:T-box transcription factor TBX21-like n=1 Tax=Trichosurus vulpecula TaxID=9337 RepID=UPI00186AE83A|nr:T-box transcription factor TBX21-like [Trichosurus vulpecula]